MDRKKTLFGELTPYLEAKGYQPYLTGGDPSYVLVDGELVVSFFFNFRSNGEIGVSPLCLTNYEVEDYILKIGTPSNYVEVYREKKKYHPATVEFRRLPQSVRSYRVIVENDVKEYAASYINFLENEGASFIQQYSYLPDILKEMSRLNAEGKYWNEILAGGPEHLFRGIIICRLCNDSMYSNRLNWLNEIFSTADLDAWKPYWENLKAILQTIEPKYNLY